MMMEKEDRARLVCGRMHVAVVELNRQFMPVWRRKNEHITLSHYFIFLQRYRSLLLERRETIRREISQLVPSLREVNKILGRRGDEDNIRERLLQEDKVIKARDDAVQARIGQIHEELERLQAEIKERTGVIDGEEQQIVQLKQQAEIEELRMATVWSQASQSLATLTARDIGKLKAAMITTASTSDSVRCLAFACCALLDGERVEDRAARKVFVFV